MSRTGIRSLHRYRLNTYRCNTNAHSHIAVVYRPEHLAMCEGTLCAKHHTLAIEGVLSGVRRAHHLKTVFEEWRVVGLCYGRVCVSGHAVRHAPDTGSNR